MERPDIPELYIWEPALSPHKLPLFNACAASARVGKAVYIAATPLTDERQKQGWHAQPPHNYIENPSKNEVADIVARSHPRSIHMFAGLHWVNAIVQGLQSAIRYKRRFGIFSEPRVLEGWRGKLRLAHSWATESKLRRHSAFIFAVGAHGERWFHMSGYRHERVFPFAYFLDAAALPAGHGVETGLQVGFVGRLEPAKGFDLFLQSVALLPQGSTIHIAGSGALEPQIASAMQVLGQRIVFHGVLPMSDVPDLMSRLDILVLPSTTTDDGWGAVISEALLEGVYGISSAFVGASMCLRDPSRGQVVQPLTPAGIAEAVMAAAKSGYLAPHWRVTRSAWARQHISAAAGARHLLDIIDHVFHGAPRPHRFID